MERIQQKDWKTLLLADQLKREQNKGVAFVGFSEGEIDFPPTYRYNRGNRIYSEEKQRVPSYCDRILWKSLPGASGTLNSYNCTNALVTSDHSPVYATFSLDTHYPNVLEDNSASDTGCYLRLSNMTASLRLQGSRQYNLYLNIVAIFLEGQICTEAQSKTRNPQWGDQEVKLFSTHKEWLATQHLFFLMKDRGVRDDQIGTRCFVVFCWHSGLFFFFFVQGKGFCRWRKHVKKMVLFLFVVCLPNGE